MRHMVDMVRTPEEKEEAAPATPASDGPDYPWGLCISLTEEDLEKLNLDPADCEIGTMVHLFAMAKVTSISQSDNENSGPCCRVELQITHLDVEDEDIETVPDSGGSNRGGRYK